MHQINLVLLSDEFTLYRLPHTEAVPAHVLQQSWFTISRTDEELSILLPSQAPTLDQATKIQPGWRCFKVDAKMEFELVGILARITAPLKENEIPVFVVSTFDTDYVFVDKANVDKAAEVLGACEGIEVRK